MGLHITLVLKEKMSHRRVLLGNKILGLLRCHSKEIIQHYFISWKSIPNSGFQSDKHWPRASRLVQHQSPRSWKNSSHESFSCMLSGTDSTLRFCSKDLVTEKECKGKKQKTETYMYLSSHEVLMKFLKWRESMKCSQVEISCAAEVCEGFKVVLKSLCCSFLSVHIPICGKVSTLFISFLWHLWPKKC